MLPLHTRDAPTPRTFHLPRERPAVAGSAIAFPPHRYSQKRLARAAARVVPGFERREGFLERFFARVGVEERHLALEPDAYAALDGMQARNDAWIEHATALGERCLRAVLDEAGVAAEEVGQLTTTTVTGLAVPSLDARLMNRLPLSRSLKRVPLFGLGCLGGAAGLARTAEYLRAFPDQVAVLLAVELCSLTLQRQDVSMANIIASGLFGDGAAAVLLAGAEHPLARRAPLGDAGAPPAGRPRVVDSRSVFFDDTERVMGWDVVDGGFSVVLSPDVPDLVRREVPPAVDAFLDDHGLTRDDVATWVSHPGGPAVMDALEEGLELSADALAPSRRALAEVGNLSSASVLQLLDEHRRRRPPPGAPGLMLAMGPAFCAELVLLRW
ncbi:MAG TPA: 3-oxoacyl-[acyl-carrier-protein] synthase III C-terminal domain-containing protein [Sandaracinaceae bacterium LLY-WYZ-13_1]|nr:3-oxoacyl-[acyl-carrier-protein] synthase III C-terminal domain-containing protein [Sandaracinaceae bacterium LLY-WYZ-13_1]